MKRLFLILSITVGLTLTGCSSDDSGHSHGEGADHTHSEETHQHAAGEQTEAAHQHESVDTTGSSHTHSGSGEEHTHSGESAHNHEDEESGSMLGLDQTYDEVRKGVRLTLSYDSEASSFIGRIENTTQEALPQVSVGVNLSNGTVLGPTTPVNLDPGESQSVELNAAGETFESWNTHSEIDSDGHSHGENGDHTHQK